MIRSTVVLCAWLALASTASTWLSAGLGESASQQFHLSVAGRDNLKRDFIRDWAAVMQKWGNGVPSSVVSTFSLADSGTSMLYDEQNWQC